MLLYIYNIFSYSVQLAAQSVGVTPDSTGIIYAGSVLTLTCHILLSDIPTSLLGVVSVSATWFEAQDGTLSNGNRITVNPAAPVTNIVYLSTLVFNTVRTGDMGTYTCQATVSHPSPFITDITTPQEVMISVASKCCCC